MSIWSTIYKTSSSWSNKSKISDFTYDAGKVGTGRVGRSVVGSNTGVLIYGTLWDNAIKY